MTMPWCSSGSIIEVNVVSCPPCKLEVEVKSAAGLPTRAPDIQSGAVRWKYATGDIETSSPCVHNGIVYIGDLSGVVARLRQQAIPYLNVGAVAKVTVEA